MSFVQVFSKIEWASVKETIYSASTSEVERALARMSRLSLEDLAALLSPASEPYLEELAEQSKNRTQRKFGKTIQIYAPLYLSNECQNICTYCGFSFDNKIARKTLTEDEIRAEAQILKERGFEHVLLVTGEASRTVGVDYIESALHLLRPYFSQVSIEVQPLQADEYLRLRRAGLHGVYVYQETYDVESYKKHHPKGKKSKMSFRLETPDRLGQAGTHKIGLGALLGLSDWRVDSWFTGLHLSYLRKKYWRSKYSISFPRIRPAQGVSAEESSESLPTERNLLQLICAYRLFDDNVELSLSTRESAWFRDQVFPLGITTLSAGSSTEPGGYSKKASALEQFSVDDTRTAKQVAESIESRGYEVVWKDWDQAFASQSL